MLDTIEGSYALVHPVKLDNRVERCCLTQKPFAEHLYRPSPSKMGHREVWQLIIPLDGKVFVDKYLGITCTRPYSCLHWLDGCTGHLHIIEEYAEKLYRCMAERSYF